MTELGRLIVVEGIDGSGTSTQARAIHEALVAAGRESWLTAEPTTGAVGRFIRDLLEGRQVLDVEGNAERIVFAMLFAADRHEHVYSTKEGMLDRTTRGIDVVSARYVLSSLAYEADRPDEYARVLELNRRFPIPELTVYLECPVDVALARIHATRPKVDLFENRRKLELVAANYTKTIDAYPGRVLRLDAQRPMNEITDAVLRELNVSRG